jgi:hypothetical protein
MDEYILSFVELGLELAFTVRVRTWAFIWAQEFPEYWFHPVLCQICFDPTGILISLHEHNCIVLYSICCSMPPYVLSLKKKKCVLFDWWVLKGCECNYNYL